MFRTSKLNLVLELITGTDEAGAPIVAKSTISDLRVDLTENEISEVARVFMGLVKYKVLKAYVVATQIID